MQEGSVFVGKLVDFGYFRIIKFLKSLNFELQATDLALMPALEISDFDFIGCFTFSGISFRNFPKLSLS